MDNLQPDDRRVHGIGCVATRLLEKSHDSRQAVVDELLATTPRLDEKDCDEVLSFMARGGYLIEAAGDLVLTERGRVFFQMATDKLAVADITQSNSVVFTEEDREKYLGASEDVPG